MKAITGRAASPCGAAAGRPRRASRRTSARPPGVRVVLGVARHLGAGRQPGLADEHHQPVGSGRAPRPSALGRDGPLLLELARERLRPGPRRPRPPRRRRAPSGPPRSPPTARAGRRASGRRRRGDAQRGERAERVALDEPQRPAHRLQLERAAPSCSKPASRAAGARRARASRGPSSSAIARRRPALGRRARTARRASAWRPGRPARVRARRPGRAGRHDLEASPEGNGARRGASTGAGATRTSGRRRTSCARRRSWPRTRLPAATSRSPSPLDGRCRRARRRAARARRSRATRHARARTRTASLPGRGARAARRLPAPARRVAAPRDEDELAARARVGRRTTSPWCPRRRRDERGRRRRRRPGASPAVSARPARAGPRARGRLRSRARRASRPARPARGSRAARRARLTLRFYPQSFELDARRLDRHPRRRALRDRPDAHRRPRRVDPRDHAAAGACGSRGGCRAPARGRRRTGCCSAPRARWR